MARPWWQHVRPELKIEGSQLEKKKSWFAGLSFSFTFEEIGNFIRKRKDERKNRKDS
jgi:hypothetical protein